MIARLVSIGCPSSPRYKLISMASQKTSVTVHEARLPELLEEAGAVSASLADLLQDDEVLEEEAI
jgi:hypothetical protein